MKIRTVLTLGLLLTFSLNPATGLADGPGGTNDIKPGTRILAKDASRHEVIGRVLSDGRVEAYDSGSTGTRPRILAPHEFATEVLAKESIRPGTKILAKQAIRHEVVRHVFSDGRVEAYDSGSTGTRPRILAPHEFAVEVSEHGSVKPGTRLLEGRAVVKTVFADGRLEVINAQTTAKRVEILPKHMHIRPVGKVFGLAGALALGLSALPESEAMASSQTGKTKAASRAITQ